ncbi:type II toxin-antitoxin system RelE/ParE family toxin [candidate division KSB1 bacterium]|nr:type II toxin-antitoxin system RelE/ParE family toxin [candidate division KSB1 bacterium]
MSYKVYLIEDAEKDILEIYDYVARNDSRKIADLLIQKIEEVCGTLSSLPNRGHVPPELERISVFDYKEIHYKPYRIIYEIIGTSVFIHCVLDGRRNLQELLAIRLIR